MRQPTAARRSVLRVLRTAVKQPQPLNNENNLTSTGPTPQTIETGFLCRHTSSSKDRQRDTVPAKFHITYPLLMESCKVRLRIIPFLVWFGVGILGQCVASWLQSKGLASTTAANLAFLIFVLGALAAINLSTRLRLFDETANDASI